MLFKTILASSLVASSMLAEGIFIGGEVGYQQSKIAKFKDDGPTLGVKIGYDFDTYRIYSMYKHTFKIKDNFIDI